MWIRSVMTRECCGVDYRTWIPLVQSTGFHVRIIIKYYVSKEDGPFVETHSDRLPKHLPGYPLCVAPCYRRRPLPCAVCGRSRDGETLYQDGQGKPKTSGWVGIVCLQFPNCCTLTATISIAGCVGIISSTSWSFAVGIHMHSRPFSTNVRDANSRMSSRMAMKP